MRVSDVPTRAIKHADDPIMKRCAEECLKCEAACREVVKNRGGMNRK